MNNSKVFNWRFYLYNNPDLIQAGLVTQSQALSHWTNSGLYEGRQAHPAFHTVQYVQRYGDLKNAFGYNYQALANHYINNGVAEGRFGHMTPDAHSYAMVGYGRVTLTSKYTGHADSWYNPMTVSCAAKFAGTIDSIMWKDFEFINSYDHGRQASFAWQYGSYPNGTPTHPRFGADWAEFFNPTEPGREADAVGYTSSSRLVECKHTHHNVLDTSNSAAYWKTVAESKGNYSTVDSKDIIRKVVVVSPMGIPNLTRISAFLTPEANNPKKAVPCRFEAPSMYINPELAHFYECNAGLTSLTQIQNAKHPKFYNSDMWDGNPTGGWFGSQGGEVNGVVIAYNGLSGEGGRAIGALVIPSAAFKQITYQVYFQNHQNATTTPINNTRSMGAAVYVDDGSKYVEFTAYIAVGHTPQEVMDKLKQAKEQNP
jgi:hypothetical protein